MQFSIILRRFLHSGRLLGVLGTEDKLWRPKGTEEASGGGGGVSQGPGTISAYYTSSQLSAMEAWLSLRGPQLPEVKAKRLLQQCAIKMISPGGWGMGGTFSYLTISK